MAGATLFSVLGKVPQWLVDCIVNPIKFQFQCLFYYDNNIKTLKDEVNTLKNIREGVKLSVDAAERNIEVIAPTVQDWLTKVEAIGKEADEILEQTTEVEMADEILEQTTEVEMGCLTGLCPNLASHYSWSRKAMETTQNIHQLKLKLKEEGVNYPKLAYPRLSRQMLAVPTEGIKSFESRKSTAKQIMDALQDNEINMIGICGMGGIGKTTMVKEIGERAKVENIFDEVAMATVSANQDLKKIQDDLASMLDLKLDSNGSLARTERVFTRLSNGKRILVILDDVWEEIDLGNIGIPFGAGHRGCKIVLTSRNEKVCSVMRSKKNFTVQVLTGDEGWDLFKEVAEIDNGTNELQSIAKNVADECKGLPLAIVTLAKALKNAEVYSWNDTLRQLRGCKGMPEKVQLSIKLSYNMLKIEEAKPLLLLCSLFPEDVDIPIECLVRYAIGLRLRNQIQTIAEARDMVNSSIDHLKSCYLILGGGEETVRLHDVVRDVCISIASKDKGGYLVRCEAGLTEWPQVDSYKDYTAISFKFDDLERVPIGLDCPNLKHLQLQCRRGYIDYKGQFTRFDSGDFFKRMKELRIVALRSMSLHLQPLSFTSLVNLRTLCLDCCELHPDTLILGSLKNLEILSFFESALDEFPSDIGELGSLRVLDLRRSKSSKPFPPGVLSKLCRLEELYMGGLLLHRNENIRELKKLSYLNTLQIEESPTGMPELRGFCFNKLKSFHILIGSKSYGSSGGYWFQNRFEVENSDMRMLSDIGIEVLLKSSEIVKLDNTKGLGRNLFDALDQEDSVNWKELAVSGADELEYLICRDTLAAGSFAFGNLQKLVLKLLPAMKSLFPCSLVKCFVQLQRLEISQCEQLEYIVAKEEGGDENDTKRIVFPKLNFLKMEYLPMLRSFYANSDSLFHGQVYLPSLETMVIKKMGNVLHLVRNCNKLSKVVVAGQLKLFQSLHELDVRDCDALVAVFDFEWLNVTGRDVEVTFDKLDSLELFDLPQLTHIWRMVPKEFQGFKNLRSIDITRCHSLRYLLSPYMKKLLVNLQELDLCNCEVLEEIINWKELEVACRDTLAAGSFAFGNLKKLKIWALPAMKSLFPCSLVKCFVQLQRLEIRRCEQLEYIVAKEEGGDENDTERIVFPKLNYLWMKDLPMLRSFYPNSDSLFHKQVYLPSLEEMIIENMGNVLHLVDCQMQVGSFDKFPVMKVQSCAALGAVFDFEGVRVRGRDVVEVTFDQLDSLVLVDLPQLTHIWRMVPKEFQGFKNLRSLFIEKCGNLRYLLSPTVAKLLVNLQQLELRNCEVMEEIINWKELEVACRGTLVAGSFAFGNLQKLVLKNLPTMKSLFPCSLVKCFVQLQRLKISRCEQLEYIVAKEEGGDENDTERIVFPKLNYLKMGNLPMLRSFYPNCDNLFCGQVYLPSLETMYVRNCNKLSKVVVAGQLKLFQSLHELDVRDCDALVAVFDFEWLNVTGRDVEVTFDKLDSLELFDLPQLTDIWRMVPKEFQGFKNLRSLVIWRCGSLRYLLSPTVAKLLVSLQELQLTNCEVMEEIINWKELEVDCVDELKYLICRDTLAAGSFAFGNLQKLEIWNLPAMKSLFPCSLVKCFVQLQRLEISRCEQLEYIVAKEEGGDEHDTKRIVFPKLNYLGMKDLPMLRSFYPNSDSLFWGQVYFPSMKKMVIRSVVKLQFMKVESCDAPVAVFDYEGLNVTGRDVEVTFDQLDSLELSDLPQLTHIWRMVPKEFQGFKNLRSIDITRCHSLRYLLSPYMKKLLVNLQELELRNCEVMEEIINWKELEVACADEPEYLICRDTLAAGSFAFGNLINLELDNLPAMKSLFPCSLVKCFVQLQRLEIRRCEQLEYIVAKEEGGDENDTKRIVFPKLNYLEMKDLPMLRSVYPNSDGLFCGQVYLPSLETMVIKKMGNVLHLVRNCNKLSKVVVAGQLKLFQSLHELDVRDCDALVAVFDFEWLNVTGRDVEVTFDKLDSLELFDLPQLTHIWRMVPKEFQGFKNLRSLVIIRCHSLRYLLSPTVAKLLVNLQQLDLENCKAMKEIISMEQDGSEINVAEEMTTDKIVFSQLSSLKLVDLENLTVFCFEKYECQFLSLTEVVIRNCKKMKNFCSGPICTPDIVEIGRQHFWRGGDLNTIIQCADSSFTNEDKYEERRKRRRRRR